VIRAVFFLENYRSGGGERYVLDWLAALDPGRWECTLLCNRGALSPDTRATLNTGVNVREIGVVSQNRIAERCARWPRRWRRPVLTLAYAASPLFYLVNVLRFVAVLRRLRPTLVQCFNGAYPGARGSLAMVVAAALVGTPAVLTVVGSVGERLVSERLTRPLRDRLIRRVSRTVVVNAETLRRAFVEERGFDAERVVVIRNGLADCAPGDAARFLAAVGGEKLGETLFVCVARLEPGKGVANLLDAFATVRGEANAELVVVGDGPEGPRLKERAAALGLSREVILPGRYSGPVTDVLEAADVFVIASLGEGLPYVLLEAMRAARAIVATNVGGVPEAVTDEVEALLVPPGNAAELAERMLRLARARSERARLAKAARARYERDFSLAMMHDGIEKLYERVLAADD
jgi:glycosyltransferase involved in cell wall biosynthesis